MKEHQIFGYIRVSAKDQNVDRQIDALAIRTLTAR